MASGRAVVASRVAGIPDVATEGVDAVLVPGRDAAALRAALLRLRDDPGLRSRLARAARRTALGRLSWDAVAQAFEASYAAAGEALAADQR
jgi:glycosyltransferase involved in cell wall biosynthesis